MTTDELIDDEDWWATKLDSLCSEASLPLDFPRSRVRSKKRSRAAQPLAPAASADIAAIAAAAAVVLSRYGNAQRVAVGLAGETQNGLDEAAFVVAELEAGLPFSALAADLARQIHEVAGRRPPSIPSLAQRLGGAGIVDRNPIFSVAVSTPELLPNLQNVLTDAIVFIEHDQGEAVLVVDYSARQFAAPTAARFASHIANVLSMVAAEPEHEVGEIDFVGNEEREWLLGLGGLASLSRETAEPVHLLVDRIASANPESAAIHFAGVTRTYGWLCARAAGYSKTLAEAGARPGDRVGLCMTAGDEAIGAVLGIVSGGMSIVPLDHSLPKARTATIAATAGIRMAIVSPALREQLPELEGVLVIEEPDCADGAAATWRPVPVDGEAELYLLFTSGSTGVPKGVAMPHRALANLIDWQMGRSGRGAALRTLQRTSIAFDVGFQEIFSTLCAGGTLVVIDDEARADVSLLPGLLTKHRITRTFLPPVALHQLAESLGPQGEAMPALEEVIVAGEQLRITPSIRQLFRNLSAYLENQYGPTETHVATAYRLQPPVNAWPTLPPIGKPIGNAVVLLLDERQGLVPSGTVGEICIGGQGVAKGYVNQERDDAFTDGSALTAGMPFRKLYRTGDFGRIDTAGELHFVGRRDDQFKIRGYRVELGEIEVALGQIRGLRDSAVTVQEEAGGSRRIVVYVVTEAPGVPSAPTIRRKLEERLPPFMVPALSCIVHLEALPLTRTGKIDRLRLPAPAPQAEVAHVAQKGRDDLEEHLAAIWARNLELGRVDVDDDFFELGGHSLLAIKIIAEVNAWLGITVPLAKLLRGRTVRELARAASALLENREALPASVAAASPSEGVKVELPNGRELLCLDPNEARYFYQDIFEHRTYHRGGIQYPPGACIVDVGGNIGMFALYALEQAPDARIIAFEPVPALFEILKRNLAALSASAMALPEALSDREEQAELTYYPALSGMSSLRADRTRDSALLNQIVANLAGTNDDLGRALLVSPEQLLGHRFDPVVVNCRTTTLSAALRSQSVERIDLLKVDVQRSELAVLRGIEAADWARIRQVVVEVHDEDGALAGIKELLDQRGFETTVEQNSLHRGTPVHFVYATCR
jgi:amino acid adenylation domain-containing protein/FkbM family methyltransferase